MTGGQDGQGGQAVTLRELSSQADYEACVALQKATWGAGFTEVVPASLLMVSQKVGGVAAGAFAGSGRMVGFVWGITGIRDRRPAHWSHMLAVTDDDRGTGLGRRLKRFQRDLLIRRGVDVMYWTFDPLVARNAHLNLNRLGARIHAYVPDYYGPDTDSELHSGLGTDRFIVEWRLRDARTRRALAGTPPVADYARFDQTPAVSLGVPSDRRTDPGHQPFPASRDVRVEVPVDIQTVKRADPALAWRWREITRRAFQHYLGAGYVVPGLYRTRDNRRAFYLLSRGRA